MSVSGDVRPRQPLWDQALAPFVRFSRVEAAGGLVLVASALAALIWANSPWAPSYFALWETQVGVQFGGAELSKTLGHWINDGLMAVFFFMVGLEIKREILVGELNSLGQAIVPVVAALGGMAVPAAIFTALNQGSPAQTGWGIPMATDIAFALGVLSLLGDRVPAGLKVFLAAVAIVDDIGAVLVIAIWYSGAISLTCLTVGAVIFACMLGLNLVGARHPAIYALLGVAMWLAFLSSGVHATVAGVLAAMAVPARARIRAGAFAARARRSLERFEAAKGRDIRVSRGKRAALDELDTARLLATTPLQRIEHTLHPYVAFGIMPLFALANAGVALTESAGLSLTEPVSLGIVVGLVVGKQVGVFLPCWAMFRFGLAQKADGLGAAQYYGAACLAGIGFTMSIFISGLAFAGHGDLEARAKVAVLTASTLAGVVGYLVLRLAGQQTRAQA